MFSLFTAFSFQGADVQFGRVDDFGGHVVGIAPGFDRLQALLSDVVALVLKELKSLQ